MPVGPSYLESWRPSSSTSRVGGSPGHRGRPGVRHVGEERTEGHDELDPEIAREPDHELGERPPAVVRLDPQQDHSVAVGSGNRRVEERVLRPLDPAGQPLVERHRGPHGLEVDEPLRVDVREALPVPLLHQVAGRDGSRLAPVVPSPEGRHHHGLPQRGRSAMRRSDEIMGTA